MTREFTADELASEEWRPIPDFPGYDASSLGRIRGWRKCGRGMGGLREWPLLLAQERNRYGYRIVRLRVDGRKSPVSKTVHQLVMRAFVGDAPPGMQIRHFPDRRKSNNRIANLSYGTAKDNSDDKLIHGTVARGERHGRYVHGEDVGRSRKRASFASANASMETVSPGWFLIGAALSLAAHFRERFLR